MRPKVGRTERSQPKISPANSAPPAVDNVIGILHAIDVIKSLASGRADVNAATIAREALTVPETITADDLLVALRQRGVREALVIDEYGGTAGLVTFEWLMERIVGNLGAAGAGRISVNADGSAEIDGLTLVPDVNEQFGLHIDEDTYTTLGGYVMGRIGRRARTENSIINRKSTSNGTQQHRRRRPCSQLRRRSPNGSRATNRNLNSRTLLRKRKT